MIDIGPQYKRDDEFTRRLRWQQSWYRARVLRVAHGLDAWPLDRLIPGGAS